jgi:type IV pilus assembly protein PilY1
MMACDTGMNNTFMGTPSVVDWDLDSMADSAYFGLVRDSNTDAFSSNDEDSGRVMKISFADEASPTSWNAPATIFNADKPLSIIPQPVPSIDKNGNHWLFFGSGRYYSSADKLNSYSQYLFGVKDLEVATTYPVTMPNLLDVTAAEVYTDGSLETSLIAPNNSTLATFDDIVENIDAYDSSKTDNTLGWYLKLPPIVGTEGGVPSTRNTTRSALLGGTLFTSVFQPSEDPCEGEGRSRLYGLYYKTGTSYPKIPPIFGSSIETIDGTVKYKTNRFVELGRGQASAPGLHSGSGDDSVKVTTQLSTGEMVQSEANTVNKIRSGRISWKDQ